MKFMLLQAYGGVKAEIPLMTHGPSVTTGEPPPSETTNLASAG